MEVPLSNASSAADKVGNVYRNAPVYIEETAQGLPIQYCQNPKTGTTAPWVQVKYYDNRVNKTVSGWAYFCSFKPVSGNFNMNQYCHA